MRSNTIPYDAIVQVQEKYGLYAPTLRCKTSYTLQWNSTYTLQYGLYALHYGLYAPLLSCNRPIRSTTQLRCNSPIRSNTAYTIQFDDTLPYGLYAPLL